jgi:exodeoxyribonuclease V
MTLNDEQNHIADEVDAFLRAAAPPNQFLIIHGLAGSGKSYLLSELANRYPSATLCAPTGKAATVLSRRSGRPATTIHSAIYNFNGKYLDDEGREQLSFSQKIEDMRWASKAALMDELSMVDRHLGGDLLSTGARLIGTGDPGQLPPVRGMQMFSTPDFKLHHIHRQALESPIIRQAHAVRNGERYRADGEDFRVSMDISHEDIVGADVVLCWKNDTRRMINTMVRQHRGIEGIPRAGEPVMCLLNDHGKAVMNGGVYTLLEDYNQEKHEIYVVNERQDAVRLRNVRMEGFDPPADEYEDTIGEHPFTLAYASTVHKFQGSEADRIIIIDEYSRGDDRQKWLYTAITRAKKSVLIRPQVYG